MHWVFLILYFHLYQQQRDCNRFIWDLNMLTGRMRVSFGAWSKDKFRFTRWSSKWSKVNPPSSLKEILSSLLLFIIAEWHHDRHELPFYFCQLNDLYWARTVKLKLTVHYPLEMLFILRKNALPLLEHLNITVEQEQLPLKPYVASTPFPISFSEKDIRQTVDLAALRTVVFRVTSLWIIWRWSFVR